MTARKKPERERDLMRDYLLGFYGGVPRIAQGTIARVVAGFWREQREQRDAGGES